jgi:hypothetical protein
MVQGTASGWVHAALCCWKIALFCGAMLVCTGPEGVAATYHVNASCGSNLNPGTAELPFKTIQKGAALARPGDTVIIHEGVYRETVAPRRSGTATAPITFQAAEGENVTISGANPVPNTGWRRHAGNIFRRSATLSLDGYSDTGFFANQVFVGDEAMNEARWPNMNAQYPLYAPLAGGNVAALSDTDVRVEDPNIPDIPEGWAGATIWQNEWFVSRTGTITGGSGGVLTATMSGSWPRNGFWYYLTGKLGLVDQAKEWYYDGVNRVLYFWSPDGNMPQDVQVKRRNFGFDLINDSFIHIKNINLFACTITSGVATQGNVIDGTRAKYLSHYVTLPPLPESEAAPGTDGFFLLASHAHDSGLQMRGNNHTLKNSVLQFSAGNGVLLKGNNCLVENNVIQYTNYGSTYAAAVKVNGDGHRIMRNTIRYTGRSAIDVQWHTAGFSYKNGEIGYNDISHFGALSSDLGALYFAAYIDMAGTRIHHNSIHTPNGWSFFWDAAAIYTDLESFNATIDHNVIWNMGTARLGRGLKLSGGANRGGFERVYNNTVAAPSYVLTEAAQFSNNIFTEVIGYNGGNTGIFSNNLFPDTAPLFNNLGAGDFTLQDASPAIDGGVEISGFTDDYLGSAPDIGAFEFGRMPWRAGSTLTP